VKLCCCLTASTGQRVSSLVVFSPGWVALTNFLTGVEVISDRAARNAALSYCGFALFAANPI
jgi:hypothetical protein